MEFNHPKPKNEPYHKMLLKVVDDKVYLTVNGEKTYELRHGDTADLQIDYPARMTVINA